MDPTPIAKNLWQSFKSWYPLIRQQARLGIFAKTLLIPLGLVAGISYAYPHFFTRFSFAPITRFYAYLAQHHTATVLIWAAKRGSETTTKKLLDAGADVTWKSDWSCVKLGRGYHSNGETKEHPISHAAGLGYTSIVHLLLDAGADIEYRDGKGRTPLVLAAESNHLNLSRLLIARGADLLSCGIFLRMPSHTPIFWAIVHKNPEMLELFVTTLLESGHPKEYVERGLHDLLSYEAAQGDIGRIRYVLSLGANANYRDLRPTNPHGTKLTYLDATPSKVPLCQAARNAGADAVRALLEAGANPNIIEPITVAGCRYRVTPHTPLKCAMLNERHSESIVELLISSGTRPTQEDLDLAANYGTPRIQTLLSDASSAPHPDGAGPLTFNSIEHFS